MGYLFSIYMKRGLTSAKHFGHNICFAPLPMTQTHEQPTYVDFHNNWLDTVAKRSSLGLMLTVEVREKVIIWGFQNNLKPCLSSWQKQE